MPIAQISIFSWSRCNRDPQFLIHTLQKYPPWHSSSGLAADLSQGHLQSNLTQLKLVQVSTVKPKNRVWAYKVSPTNQQLNPGVIQGGKSFSLLWLQGRLDEGFYNILWIDKSEHGHSHFPDT